MSISNVEGCSANDSNNQRGTLIEELTDFTKKVRIEIVVSDEMTPAILHIIRLHAYTGQIGDGVLWVTDVTEFVKLCQADQTEL
jgi:nitrogen regulatory protein P-II 1